MRHSYSDLQTFGRCPNKYRYREVLKLQRIRKTDYLWLGSEAHTMLHKWYLYGEDAFWDYYEDRIREVQESPVLFTDEMAEATDLLWKAHYYVCHYLDHYNDDWEVLYSEEEFDLYLGKGREVTFTPDLIIRDNNTDIAWIVDHKFTVQFPEPFEPPDLQALLYYAGAREVVPNLAGFMFNYIRKKIPTQPQLAKTGKRRVKDLTRIDTTHGVLYRFLAENAPELLDDDAHRRRLAQLRDTDRFFRRDRLVITDEQVEAVLHDAESLAWMVESAHERETWPRVYQSSGFLACGRCPYLRICQGEVLGWNVESIIEGEYEPREPKNPYTAEGEQDG